VSLVLAGLAIAGAGASLLVDEHAMLLVLAICACLAAGGLAAAAASFGGPRRLPSIIALLACLATLGAIALGFGVVSIRGVVDAVDRARPSAAEHTDEGYRFRIRATSFDSFVYDRESAPRVHERAVGGLWDAEDDVTMMVFVERRYGRTLEQAAREEAQLVDDEDGHLLGPSEPTRFLGRTAVRITRALCEQEDSCDFVESTFFLHQDHVYHLRASQIAHPDATPTGAVWFEDVRDAFTLTPGRVRDHFTPERIARDDGPEWRVRNHVYEDAAWGVRVRGDGMKLRYGDDARSFDDDEIVIVERRNPDVLFGVRGVHLGGRDPIEVGAELEANFRAAAAPDGRAVIEARVGARTVRFAGYDAELDRTLHYRYAFVQVDAERGFELIVWGPSRAVADAELPALIARVDLLDDAAMRALRREIPPAHSDDVGHSWWVRDGAFREEDRGIVWTSPSAEWRVGPAWGGEDDYDEIVRFEAPAFGLAGRVIERDAAIEDLELGVSDAHQYWVSDRFPDAPPSCDPLGTNGCSTARLDGEEHSWAFSTLMEGELVWHVEVWGTRSAFDRHAEAAVAAVRAIARDTYVQERPGYDVNERMGYQLRVPWSGDGPFDGWWPSLDSEVGTLTQYSRGIEIVGVFAARRDPAISVADQREQLIRRFYGQVLRGAGRWTGRRARLAGRPATLRERSVPLALGGTSIYTMEHARVLYVILIEHRNGIDPARVARGFTLLE
jgi:hypothetical protein